MVYSFLDGIWKVKEKQKADYSACQAGFDDKLRAAGHSEEHVAKDRLIRLLGAKCRDAMIGYYTAWIGSIDCLLVFPRLASSSLVSF